MQKNFKFMETASSNFRRCKQIKDKIKENVKENPKELKEIKENPKDKIKEKDKPNESMNRFRKTIDFSPTKFRYSNEFEMNHRKSASMMSSDNFYGSFNNTNAASRKSIFKKTAQPSRFHARDSLFDIPQEDRIFDDEKLKSCIEFIHKIKSEKTKKEKIEDKKIQKLYKTSPDILKKIKSAKNMKFLDLEVYQRNLLLSASEVLSKDSVRTLEVRLNIVRKNANQIKNIGRMKPLFEEIKEQDNITLIRLRESYNRILEMKYKKDVILPDIDVNII
jgi:hypothetical protein